MTVDEIDAFWMIAKFQLGLDGETPDVWAFGSDDDETDRQIRLVLDGTKTATSSSVADYDGEDDLPRPGELHIVVDAREHPRALIETTGVHVVPFDKVDADHATADGADSLAAWQAANSADFGEAEVVLESFKVIHPQQ